MDAKYFFYLYLRNAKSTFFSGFVGSAQFQYATPFLWLVHVSLLPLTLTLGAALKSLFDVITRQSITEDLINERKDVIKSMDNEEIERLVQDICAYDAKSDSSQMLVRELNQLSLLAKTTINDGYASKRRELAWEQLEDPEEKRFSANFVEFIDLDCEYQSELDNYNIVNQKQVGEFKLRQQQSLIINYIDQEKNQGKKMLQVIMGMFKVPVVEKLLEENDIPNQETRQQP